MSNYLGNIRTNTNYTGLKEDVENRLRSMSHIGNALADHIKGAKDIVKRLFVPGMLFEDMGITYIGPIDGHDVRQMVNAFENASKLQKAVIVHVCTKKEKDICRQKMTHRHFTELHLLSRVTVRLKIRKNS